MAQRTTEQYTARRAELHVDRTSPACTRYTLVEAGKRIWITRVEPSERGHAGARARMAAWALANRVAVVERQPAELVSSEARR